jgi:GT2 family glycosyltransferase
MSLVSFIIVNWNGLSILGQCLESIQEFCGKIPHEVIVVDNGSTDGSIEHIIHNYPEVRLIRNSQNFFFAIPTNQGTRTSRGNYLFLLNNDVRLPPKRLEYLLETLDSDHGVGAVAPQLVYPDGRIQPSCRRLPTFLNLFQSGLQLDKLFSSKSWKMVDWGHNNPRDVEQPMMSALLIRRECWEDVGELDEHFPLFEPSAKAIHHEAWSGKKLGFRQAYLSAQGLYRYFRKYQVKSMFSWRWPVLLCLCAGLTTILSLRNIVKLWTPQSTS